jgi:hypothetical protein
MILRNNNNLMFKILLNSDLNSVKENFKMFLNNYFYENILSNSNFNDEYLILICKLLKNEIFKMNNKNEKFLNEFSIVANILNGLIIKNEIKNYFNFILNDVFEFIENKSDEIKHLSFNINEINDEINKKIKNIENQLKKNKKNNNFDKNIIIDENGIFFDFLLNFNKNYNNDKNTAKLIIEKINNQNKIFNEKYKKDLNSKVLIEILNNNNNDNMKDFIYNQLNELKNDDKIFNSEIFNVINKFTNSDSILNFYQFYFFKIIEIIEKIINKLNENINLIPFSIKIICKIITELMKKKFIGISKIEINSFVAKFFFEILLNQFLSNPNYFCLYDDVIISNTNQQKINILILIINQLISGKFFNSNEFPHFSPFNSFFIEIMPKFFTFFDKLVDINLPDFIKNVISNDEEEIINNENNENNNENNENNNENNNNNNENNENNNENNNNENNNNINNSKIETITSKIETNTSKIETNTIETSTIKENTTKNIEYDYFKENPEETLYHKSICFNLTDLKTIFTIIKNNENKFFSNLNNNKSLENFYKTYQKLSQKIYWEEIINPLIKKDKTKNEISFILITKLDCNEYFNNLNNIKIINKCFSIKEEKINENDKNYENKNIFNNIIKIKNFLCKLLFNFQILKIKDFPETILNQTKLIIKEFKNYLNNENYDFDNKIFCEWHINSLLKMFNNFSNDFIENELYFSLNEEINNKINDYDFECLSLIFDRLNYAKKKIFILNENIKKLNEIQISKKILDFIENAKVEVEIKMKIDEKNKNFIIIIKNEKNKKNEKFKGEKIQCSTIFDFIKKFPNFNYYQQFQDLEIFKLVEEINLSNELNEYYKFCFSMLKKNKLFENIKNSDELEFINHKLQSIILTKIYDKIYPQEMCLEDIKIFQFCMKLNWIEYFHLLNKNNKIFDNFLPKIEFLFKNIENVKNPLKKCEIFSEINKIIYSNILFNANEKYNFDIDEKLPFFLYSIIKTKPIRIYSQIKFIDLFVDEEIKIKKGFGILIAILTCAIEKIKKFSFSDLNNVTENDFINNCNKMIANDNNNENNVNNDVSIIV